MPSDPKSQINLKHGLTNLKDVREWETCTAGAGSLLLEFATLSRLTGEPIYEVWPHKSVLKEGTKLNFVVDSK